MKGCAAGFRHHAQRHDEGSGPEALYADAVAAREAGRSHDARKLLEKAAAAGHPTANYELATDALRGEAPSMKNVERMGVGAVAGIPEALYELGAFFDRTNPAKDVRPGRDPVPLMRRAADAGQLEAFRWLAIEAGHDLHATEAVGLLRQRAAARATEDVDWLSDADLDGLAGAAAGGIRRPCSGLPG